MSRPRNGRCCRYSGIILLLSIVTQAACFLIVPSHALTAGLHSKDISPAAELSNTPRQLCSSTPTRLAAALDVADEEETSLQPSDVDTIVYYVNMNNKEDLKQYLLTYSELGIISAQKNGWTQGAYVIDNVMLKTLDKNGLIITANVKERSFWGQITVTPQEIQVPFLFISGGKKGADNKGAAVTAEMVKRELMALSRSCGLVESTASMYKIPLGSYGGLPDNMRLNNVPHSTLVRTFIYRGAASALYNAIMDQSFPRRMQVRCTVPELNVEMDTYRVGTMLEMVREMATNLAEAGMKVKICIQGSMGEGIFTGLPLNLSGMMAIMERMDWGAYNAVEDDGAGSNLIEFGKVGAEHMTDEDDVVMVIAPQSIVGASIFPSLVAMCNKATGQGKPFVLINPMLRDRPSSAGLMGTRGRAERLEFEKSFKDVYHFRCLYPSSAAYYPIVGACYKSGPFEPYVVFKREAVTAPTSSLSSSSSGSGGSEGGGGGGGGDDRTTVFDVMRKGGRGGDRYVPLGTFDDNPGAEQLGPLLKLT